MNDFTENIIKEFRENGGVTEMFGPRLVLLHTIGAKSGKERINPVVSRRDEDGRIIVFASKAGADTHPAWFHNLVAHPNFKIEVRQDGRVEEIDVNATVLEGDERDRLWNAQLSDIPTFGEYQEKTDRIIPVVALTPA